MFKSGMFLTSLLVLQTILSAECGLFDSETSNAIYNDTIGDLAVHDQLQIIPPNIYGLSLITPHMFTRKGLVHTVSYRTPMDMMLENTTPVLLQVWRPVSGDRYELVSSIPHIPTTRGIQTVRNLRMFVQRGDYLGISCRSMCNIVKDGSVMVTNKIRFGMSGDRFAVTNQFTFSNPPLSARIPISATIEVNSPVLIERTVAVETSSMVVSTVTERPTTKPALESTPKPTTKPTTIPTQGPTDRSADDRRDPNLWAIVAVIIVIAVLFIVILIFVCCCSRRAQRGRPQDAHYKQQINSPRSASRPASMIEPDYSSTLGRNPTAHGMRQTNEMIITNDTRQPKSSGTHVTAQPPPPLASSSDNGTLRVAFDTGQVYENGEPVHIVPAPPTQPPPLN